MGRDNLVEVRSKKPFGDALKYYSRHKVRKGIDENKFHEVGEVCALHRWRVAKEENSLRKVYVELVVLDALFAANGFYLLQPALRWLMEREVVGSCQELGVLADDKGESE